MADNTDQTQSAALRQISEDAPRYSGYTSLVTSRREIRLLDIDASLHCRLRTVSLDERPLYSALSYYWGPAVSFADITVDGETLSLRKTLYDFLKTLYGINGPTTVWLDVLCINQREISEQSTQVAMMGDIYTQAKQVYCWLGLGEPDPQYALSYVKSGQADRSSYEMSHVLEGIKQLCSHPYFTRVWTMQECLLNANVVAMSGNVSADFDKMIRAFEPLAEQRGATDVMAVEATIAWKKLSGMLKVRKNLVQGERACLLHLVNDLADQRCQDPKDKFYGFRALAEDGHGLQVDYGYSHFDVLFQIISQRNWDCFLHIARFPQEPTTHFSRGPEFSWDPAGSLFFDSRNHLLSEPAENELRNNLVSELQIVLGHLPGSKDNLAQGLRDSAPDWLVHRVTRLELPRVHFRASETSDDSSLLFLSLYQRALKELVPQFDTRLHSVYVSFGRDLLVTVDHGSGAVLNAMSGNRNLLVSLLDPDAFRGHANSDRERLQNTLSRMAGRHVWACRVTLGVHTSRLFLLALSNISGRYRTRSTIHHFHQPVVEKACREVLELLSRYNSSQDDSDEPLGKCSCTMPDGLSSPEPPPWNIT